MPKPKINTDGVTREMTDEEYLDFQRENAEEEAYKRSLPATESEKVQAQIMYTALMTDTIIEEN